MCNMYMTSVPLDLSIQMNNGGDALNRSLTVMYENYQKEGKKNVGFLGNVSLREQLIN